MQLDLREMLQRCLTTLRKAILAFDHTVFSIALLILLSSCLAKTDSNTGSGGAPSISPVISPAMFDGALSARNRGGPIEITWNAVSTPEINEFRIYRFKGALEKEAIGTLGNDATSFLDGNTSPGQVYYYQVKAVDKKGREDANQRTVTAISYGGILSAAATGRETVNVSFSSAVGAIDEIRIYATNLNTGQKTLVGSTTEANATTFEITGLQSGTKYSFSVNVYSNTLKQEDGNEVSFEAQTQSYSFSNNDFRWQNILHIKAFGDAPNAPRDPADPNRIPYRPQVAITWLPFIGATNQTKYKLVRTQRGLPINMNVTTVCTENTFISCQVCTQTGTGAKTCLDEAVKPSPMQYDYVISLIRTMGNQEYTEELPEQSPETFVTRVAIPPSNMVLVHRASANYEMCQLLGQSTDPKNNHRCVYTGVGARPTNSFPGKPALNLPLGYYDFGYDLFVDRWELACNWTKQSAGGRCGAGGGPGDCYGINYPTSDQGQDGDVFWVPSFTNTDSSMCLIKKADQWVTLRNSYRPAASFTGTVGIYRLLDEDYAKMTTNDPGNNRTLGQSGHRPPVTGMFNTDAWKICNTQVDESYGPKRVPRMREFKVYAAWPWLQDEPGRLLPAQINSLEDNNNIGHRPGAYSCNTRRMGMSSNLAGGLGHYPVPNSIANLIHPTNYAAQAYSNPLDINSNLTPWNRPVFYTGSLMTSHCTSRYGVQDHIGNLREFVSDNFDVCDNVTMTCTGGISGIDSGNTDFNGIQFSPDAALGGVNANCRADGTTGGQNFSYFNPVLGLPYLHPVDGAIPVNNLRLHPLGNLTQDDNVNFNLTQTPPYSPKVKYFYVGGYADSAGGAGRWRIDSGTGTYYTVEGVRCVLPVD